MTRMADIVGEDWFGVTKGFPDVDLVDAVAAPPVLPAPLPVVAEDAGLARVDPEGRLSENRLGFGDR